jgi:hypothetical protein
MENFPDLDTLYQYLEEKALDYKYPDQIADLFRKLRDLKHSENEFDEAKKEQCEIDFFNFVLKNNEIKPTFTWTNDKGEVVEYPSLNRFDDSTYEYLLERLNSTGNSLLKARYSHILWLSPKKRVEHAKVAVDSYLDLVKNYEEKDKAAPREHFGLDVLHAIENAYFIAYQINYKIGEINSELRRLVTSFNFQSSSSFVLRARLIQLMLKWKRRFLKGEFDDFENICWQVAETLTKVGNIQSAIEMLEIGEKVDQKLGKKTRDWRRHIAESYEKLMNQAEEDNNLASLTFCQYALENYKKLKDERKTNDLQTKYSELKHSMMLTETRREIDLTEHMKACRKAAEKIIQNSSEEIIKILMRNKNLLPKYKDMERIAEKHSKQFVIQHLFPTEIIDQRGHLAQHFYNEEEKKYFGILQQYYWELKFNKIHLINEIFFAGINENKLSSDILLRFLNKYSWLGKNIARKLPNNKTIEYNWLNLIAPSVNEYFHQMHYYFLNPANYPNLVLSIDSLTLKIEGLLRDIGRFSGVATFYMTKDNKGRNIEREKDIHALLYEEPVKELFDEDDSLFFRFFLVEKAGFNLRHKIAHCFLSFQEYSIDYMHLLILTLLKLGKYDFVKK